MTAAHVFNALASDITISQMIESQTPSGSPLRPPLVLVTYDDDDDDSKAHANKYWFLALDGTLES